MSFVNQHKNISRRMCQNIKKARAQLKPSEMKEYFDRLSKSLEDVTADNIKKL